jgi:Protein of unknown function (DUF559)
MDPFSVPFRGSVALAMGAITDHRLRHRCMRIYPDVYIDADVPVDAVLRAQAVWCWCGGRGVVAGLSAAALHGARWIDHDANGAVNFPDRRRPPKQLVVYRDTLAANDIAVRRGIALTTPVRTAFDIGRRLDIDGAVEAIDAIYQATGLRRSGLAQYAAGYPGARGVRRLCDVVELSDEGAESVWETRTRLALVRSGLPRPETQREIFGCSGVFIGRVDMCWPRWRVIVEYDGDHHFDYEARNRDIERWNALEAAGWRVIRVKKRQLVYGRAVLLDQIRTVLRDAGADLSSSGRSPSVVLG